LLHPSAEELNYTRQERVSSWIHPHSHGRTRGHFEKNGRKEIRNSTDIQSFSIPNGMLFI
jgi:hypothetical protein